MDTVNFNFLDIEKWRIVKTIRIEKQFGSRYVWADLIYTRSVTADYRWNAENIETPFGVFYDFKKEYPEDNFDKVVLKAVQQNYSKAQFQNADVFTDMEADWFKKIYGKHIKESAIIYIEPYLNGFEYGSFPTEGREFPIFSIPLDVYVPCPDFQQYFRNEGYFLKYDLVKAEEIKTFLAGVNQTLHSIEEIIR